MKIELKYSPSVPMSSYDEYGEIFRRQNTPPKFIFIIRYDDGSEKNLGDFYLRIKKISEKKRVTLYFVQKIVAALNATVKAKDEIDDDVYSIDDNMLERAIVLAENAKYIRPENRGE